MNSVGLLELLQIFDWPTLFTIIGGRPMGGGGSGDPSAFLTVDNLKYLFNYLCFQNIADKVGCLEKFKEMCQGSPHTAKSRSSLALVPTVLKLLPRFATSAFSSLEPNTRPKYEKLL